ncbi:MAG: glutamate mutase L [Candidatus Wallbacteria bacterium]|nr:glutamate mutase L [Candidatus Wallbacteria bacterium]
MKIDLLTYEIGSTTTKVRAFHDLDKNPEYLGMGQAPTTVLEGDVSLGMVNARSMLEQILGAGIEPSLALASSSAAGGLKMTVHGLTEEMTVRAAKEASLGAGAVLRYYTVGQITDSDIRKTVSIAPNIVLLAGGVDFGERSIVLQMAKKLAESPLGCPFVYAGNRALQDEVRDIFAVIGKQVTVTENVYPKVDVLNMEPARAVIQKVFSRHILHAPGMEKISGLVSGEILPVPHSVMKGLEMLSGRFSDLMAVDIGGATTDIHSITEGDPRFADLRLEPEPKAKRTVEGDLGVFVNAGSVLEQSGDPQIESDFRNLSPMPKTEPEIRLAEELSWYCLKWGLDRHAGEISDYYGPTGKKQLVRGKDLTAVKLVIGTGGALTQLPFGEKLLRKALIREPVKKLLPLDSAKIIIDREYMLGSLGVIGHHRPEWARALAGRYFPS